MLYKNSFLPYGKIYITTAQFTTAVHVQLSLKKTSANESAPSIISPNSVIVKFSRLPFRYSQSDSRRPLPWIFHLHPSSKVVLLFFLFRSYYFLRSTALCGRHLLLSVATKVSKSALLFQFRSTNESAVAVKFSVPAVDLILKFIISSNLFNKI